MIQEHERAAGAWHSEWKPFSDLLLATGSAAVAQSLDGSAAEIGHMAEDVAKAKGAAPAEARALAREIAEHAEEAEAALEKTSAPSAARSAVEAAVAAARRVTGAAQAVQRAADADVPARVADLDAAIREFMPRFEAARQAVASPAARSGALPRSGGFAATETLAAAALLGLLMAVAGAALANRLAR
jgi:3-carboxy-cis,cis-muconate cycloisomerase